MYLDISNYFNDDFLIDFNEKISFYKKDLKKVDLLDLENVFVSGSLFKESGNLKLIMIIKGVMILPCSITLEPTRYPFEIEVKEILSENENYFNLKENTLDIFPIIWQNIVLEIPFKVVNENAKDKKFQGESWQLVEEDCFYKKTDSRFEKLKSLYSDKEE